MSILGALFFCGGVLEIEAFFASCFGGEFSGNSTVESELAVSIGPIHEEVTFMIAFTSCGTWNLCVNKLLAVKFGRTNFSVHSGFASRDLLLVVGREHFEFPVLSDWMQVGLKFLDIDEITIHRVE